MQTLLQKGLWVEEEREEVKQGAQGNAQQAKPPILYQPLRLVFAAHHVSIRRS